jgi:hypothetical protein
MINIFNDKYQGRSKMDIVRLDVPLFIRLLELSREEIKQDADIHDLAQKVIELSKESVVTMADYDELVSFMKTQGEDAELLRIRQLGGL